MLLRALKVSNDIISITQVLNGVVVFSAWKREASTDFLLILFNGKDAALDQA